MQTKTFEPNIKYRIGQLLYMQDQMCWVVVHVHEKYRTTTVIVFNSLEYHKLNLLAARYWVYRYEKSLKPAAQITWDVTYHLKHANDPFKLPVTVEYGIRHIRGVKYKWGKATVHAYIKNGWRTTTALAFTFKIHRFDWVNSLKMWYLKKQYIKKQNA